MDRNSIGNLTVNIQTSKGLRPLSLDTRNNDVKKLIKSHKNEFKQYTKLLKFEIDTIKNEIINILNKKYGIRKSHVDDNFISSVQTLCLKNSVNKIDCSRIENRLDRLIDLYSELHRFNQAIKQI